MSTETQMDMIVGEAVKSVYHDGANAPVHHVLLAGLDRQDRRSAARHATLVESLSELTDVLRDRNDADGIAPNGGQTRRQKAARLAAPTTAGAGILAVAMYVLQQLGVVVQ